MFGSGTDIDVTCSVGMNVKCKGRFQHPDQEDPAWAELFKGSDAVALATDDVPELGPDVPLLEFDGAASQMAMIFGKPDHEQATVLLTTQGPVMIKELLCTMA